MGIVNLRFAEEAGLFFNVAAVADDYDLHVGGVEVCAGGASGGSVRAIVANQLVSGQSLLEVKWAVAL